MIDAQTFQLAEETQKILLAILIIGWIILWNWKWLVATAGWFGVTALVRGFAQVPVDPLLLPSDPNKIPPDVTIYLVLGLNLAYIFLLVIKTGGSELSPFTPLYFMLPTFALLILGAGTGVYVFAGAAIIAFGVSLFYSGDKEHYRWVSPDYTDEIFVLLHRFASFWISLACLACVVFIDVRKPILEERMAQRRNAQERNAKSDMYGTQTVLSTPAPTAVPTPARSPTRPEKRTATATPTAPSTFIPTATSTPSPTVQPTPVNAQSTSPPLAPAALKQPPPAAYPRKNRAKSSAVSYAVLLKPFYTPKLTASKRASLLRSRRNTKVDWEVQYDSHERRRNEILIYFSRSDGRPLPQPTPARLAKISYKHAAFVDQLSPGQTIRIIGRLNRHSPFELFVQATDIRHP